jgi:hypothetical protein
MNPHSTLQSKILFDILPSIVRSLCDVSFGFSDQNFICILLSICYVNLLFDPSFEHSNKNVRVQIMQFFLSLIFDSKILRSMLLAHRDKSNQM